MDLKMEQYVVCCCKVSKIKIFHLYAAYSFNIVNFGENLNILILNPYPAGTENDKPLPLV